jgi:hypothetical protein
MPPGRRPIIATALTLILLALPTAASAAPDRGARGGGDRREVRAAGACGGGASSRLELKSRDGVIEVEFEVHHRRAGALWRITIVQERRVAWRGRARMRAAGRSFSLERRIRDLRGADRVMVRGLGPRGVTCVASATLPG